MDKEVIAVSAVQMAISRTDYLEPYVNSADKGPSWDGAIYVYNKPGDTHSKENLLGRVPVQVKGHETSRVHNKKIKFQAAVSDLKNFLRDGGAIYFVVYFDKDGYNTQIYFKQLLPFDLKRLIKNTGSRKSKTITLKPFPLTKSEITDVFLNFVNDMEKQRADSAIEMIWSKEELQQKGLATEFEFGYSTFDRTNTDIFQRLFDHGAYLYAKTELGVSLPVEYIENIVATVEERMDPIKVAGHVYYDKYKVIRKKDERQIQIGKSTVFSAHLKKKTSAVQFKLRGTLSERIIDCQFFLALLNNRKVYFDDKPLAMIESEQTNEVEKFNNMLNELTMAQNALKAFDVKEDLDMDNMQESDYANLRRFVAAYNGSEVSLEDIGMPFGCYRIGNLKILVCAIKNEKTKLFKIYNFFSAPIKTFLKDDENEKWEVPTFVALQSQNLIDYCNINFNAIEQLIFKVEYNPIVSQYIILFLLEVIKAYDADTNSNANLLEASELIVQAIKKREPEKTIIRINELQIVKRKRKLTKEETYELMEMLKSHQSDVEVQIGIYLLLDAYTEAKLKLMELSEGDRKEFMNLPICNFFPKDGE